MSSGHPTASFSASERGLFSPAEIQRLMRVEHQRALRYGYPISLLLVEVDRLEVLHDLYGLESRAEILGAVIAQMRAITRSSDFLGCLVDDRLMALFPHASERAADAIAARLLSGCRQLSFQSDGRTLRVTLSAGLATAGPGKAIPFEDFLATAAEGLRYAVECGGDRTVRHEAAAEVIGGLRAELEAEERSLREEQTAAAAAAALPVIEDLPRRGPGERIRKLFRALPERTAELRALEDEVVAWTEEAVRLAGERALAAHMAEHARQVDVLERRLTKLKELLDATEVELGRIAAMKGVESGLASIYRTVQGISDAAPDYERKKEILTILFEANVQLRKEIEEQSE
ncbi:MAG: diguanylate cyclase [Planctomycetota bacterium]